VILMPPPSSFVTTELFSDVFIESTIFCKFEKRN
jgi:hypothetical protein